MKKLYLGLCCGSALIATGIWFACHHGWCHRDPALPAPPVAAGPHPPLVPPATLPPGGPVTSAVHSDWKGVPLDDAVDKGLAWLVSVQGEDGGWGQDGGREGSSRTNVALESSGNDVANTAFACLALLRAGNLPDSGPRANALRRGVEFILAHVEKAPKDGLCVGDLQGTQIQRKLGQNIGTFSAGLLLSDLHGKVREAALAGRVEAALTKCVGKIQTTQNVDGSWNTDGWAPIVGTGIASRALYQASEAGVAVDMDVVHRAESYAVGNFDAKSANFTARDGAGVELYAVAVLVENAGRTAQARADNSAVIDAATARLSDGTVATGFGSMGGEEFVSYLNVSDSLHRAGGETWDKWNRDIKDKLVKLQNQDGTWCGQHCITGRVACTSAAVMTLLAERTGPKAQ